ncbi:Methionine aminopeptidase [Thermogutta terrifontis]|uniref:Methionine aminopeptidase n=1 Tax=Thermogutta terrifontis TaxID=1331910 RepID=A0A286RDG9_9BACT|nr:type I methionyl aminopeptidase [Thermogutta terrifontis]ASV74010.1 Methionine aminopeptidase [Thermogutta terrifontis]
MINLRSRSEILKMRKAGLVVWKALQLVKALVRPGVKTKDIDQAVEEFYRKCKAESLFKGYPGKVPFPAVTCISVNDEVVHGIPGERVIAEGDIVSVDTGCRVDGWCGDAAVTIPVGNVAPQVARLVDVTKRTLDLAIELAGKKTYWSEVAAAMQDYVRSHGFSVVEAFVGHGIGRQMHEEPQVPNFVNEFFLRRGDFRLQPGLVIAIEPMVNLGTKKVRLSRDYWTQLTADGKPSAHFEHTVAITEEGPYVLTGPLGPMDEQMGFDPEKEGCLALLEIEKQSS